MARKTRSGSKFRYVKADKVLDAQRLLARNPLDVVVCPLEQSILIILRNLAQMLHEMGWSVRVIGELCPEFRYFLRQVGHLAPQWFADPLCELIVIHLHWSEQGIGFAGVRTRVLHNRRNH